MLISHSHKFIFIHVYRVAGVSIQKALYPYTLPPEESLYNYLMKKLGFLTSSFSFPEHTRVKELKEAMSPKLFNSYFKFAFVRNPWDWQVSLFNYGLQNESLNQHNLFKRLKDFDAYIEWRIFKDLHLQKDFVTDNDGKLMVDFLGKFESLQVDFEKVSSWLGLHAELPHLNKSEHGNFKTYYNRRTKDLISTHFKEDIELFEYSF